MISRLNDYLFLAYIVATFIAVALVVRCVFRTLSANKQSRELPRCAKCRYAIINLPSNICPECGSDVAATGVLTAARYLKSAKPAAWTTLCMLAVILPSALLSYRLFEVQRNVAIYFEIPNFPPTPHAELQLESHIFFFGSDTRRAAPVTRATLRLKTATPIEINLDVKNRSYQITGDPNSHPFNNAEIFSSLNALGINTTDPAINTQTAWLVTLVDDSTKLPSIQQFHTLMNTRGMTAYGSSGGGFTAYSFMRLFYFIYPAALIAWTIGLLRIIPRQLHIIKGPPALTFIAANSTLTANN